MTARQFALEIDREFAEMMGDAKAVVARIGLEAVKRVVQKSPVDKGRFKGNWSLSVGQIDSATTERTDPSGGATISRAAGAVSAYSTIEGFPVIYVQNNLPYASRLEDGWSSQAPAGVLGLTVVELEAMFASEEI